MGRRSSKAEATLIWVTIVIGLPIYLISKMLEVTGWVIPVAIVALVVAFVILVKHAKRQQRLAYLRSKYRDEKLVQQIFAGYFWQGQTEEQLMDSLGDPVAKDHKLLKTIDREVWKYQQTGVNRFRLRITIENGHVVGWDKKTG